MRTTGSILVVIALVGLSACRCNKAPGPQTLPSAQPAVSALAPSASVVPVDAQAPPEVSDAGATPAAAAPIVVVVPLDFAPAKGSKFLPMKLKADGSMTRQDKVIAKLVDDKLSDDDGTPVASFSAPGVISIPDSNISFKFNDKNELEGPDGLKISIGDDGTPTVVAKANAAPEKLTGKFVDFNPTARRAATVMLAWHDLKRVAKKAAKAKEPKAKDASDDHKKKKKKKKKKN